MKNIIEYYYELHNISIGKYKEKILIKSNNEIYLFEKVENEKEVIKQYNLTNNIDKYYQFITNKEKKLFTKYLNDIYILLKVNSRNNYSLIDEIINIRKTNHNLKINIDELWQKKCDYIEYQQYHLQGKYPILDESIDYFIGLTETAISYIKYNNVLIEEDLYISHKRINKNEFYNPLNIKLDYKERDLSEYLKYVFFTNQYQNIDIKKIINEFDLTEKRAIRLLARIIYPSYYYDAYFDLITKKTNERELLQIIKRVDEYENYIYQIMIAINEMISIPIINWI